jgi:cytochrome c oxidase subunit 2
MFNLISYCDAPENWQIGFQDPATPVVEGMHEFHDFLIIISLVIGFFVCFMLYFVIVKFSKEKNLQIQNFTHSSLLEIIWTIIPSVILIFIAVPSFSLLYSLDELISPKLTLKIVGHQWYWSYEYIGSTVLNVDFPGTINFDSYMVNLDELSYGSFRLLEVDNRVILPINTHIRILVTSADVLHSWAVPSFGIKIDACPGRLSQSSLFIKREGVYYGQCSEICGINHGFMPIVVRGVPELVFYYWQFMKMDTVTNIKEDFSLSLKRIANN